jgi:hypothetical protein
LTTASQPPNIFGQRTVEKYVLVFSILAALLGVCAIVPAEYGDHPQGYYQERGYNFHDSSYPSGGYSGRD